MNNVNKAIKCEILEIEEGLYSKIVVKDDINKYYIFTLFPNWQGVNIKKGLKGYLEYKYVQAGVDTWFNNDGFTPYKHSYFIFLDFIPITNTSESITF